MRLTILQQVKAIDNTKKNIGWRHLFKVLIEIQHNQQEQIKLLKTLNTTIKAKRFTAYLPPQADDPVSDLVVKSRIPELPEDSIHEPTSPSPSPSKGLTKATTDVANPPSDPKRKANT